MTNEVVNPSFNMRDNLTLKTLTITNSNLESLPESIGNLDSLEDLYLFQHKIKACPKSLISQIYQLPSLKKIDVRSLKFPDVLRSLEKLRGKEIRIYK